HQAPRRHEARGSTGERIVGVGQEDILEEVTAKVVSGVLFRLSSATVDVDVEKIDVPISLPCCEGHHDVGEEPKVVPMAGGQKRGKIAGCRRRGMASRKSQIKIGGEIVARRVAPLAVDEAVGRREAFERVDAEVLEMCLAGGERSYAREIGRCRRALYERKDVTKSPAGDADGALRLNPAPPCWQFVDDEPVVCVEAVETLIVLQ